MRVAIDARYLREKPSGIGAYVQAIVDRMPHVAPVDRFLLWTHLRAPRPVSDAPNVDEITVRPGPNSPLPLIWPARYAPFDGVDGFHSPHNILPSHVPCPTVVTIQDVMEIDHPRLHLQGLERLVKNWDYPQAVPRALRQATPLTVPTTATGDPRRRSHRVAAERGARRRRHVDASGGRPDSAVGL